MSAFHKKVKAKLAKVDSDLFFLAVVLTVLGMLLLCEHARAGGVKILKVSEEMVPVIPVSNLGTVLSFPMKPTKVVLGKAQSFGMEYVETDLAISPLAPGARSSLFVYIYGRRFAFDLRATAAESSAVIVIQDAIDPMERAKLKSPAPPKRKDVKHGGK